MTRAFAVCCLLLAASCANNDLPKDGASCPRSVCSERGTCSFTDTHPVCACDDGYTGAACTRCAEGFHRAADESCVVDETCTPGFCANGGACFINEYGLAACACAPGYSGVTCTECRAGYHADADAGCSLDQRCHETSCARAGTCSTDGGRVQCACNADHGGEFCERSTLNCNDNNPCASTGRCSERNGQLGCVCQPGYGGSTCASCAAGYVNSDAGCVLSDSCAPSSCSFSGTCAVDAGSITCACTTGYAGARCDQCATGYHRAVDFTCVVDETCATASHCSANGTCRELNAETVCDCANGYAGVNCETCAPGFHGAPIGDGGTRCDLDTSCRPETCRFHGTCSEDAGVTRCDCQTGYLGTNCETNVDDCANSACNTGRCVDLLSAYVCLCTNGTYAQGCP